MASSPENKEPPQALGGLCVVELPCLDTIPFLAAAMAAKSFADFGAEVIKVEPPRLGARERQLGPFRDKKPDPETGGLHLYLNTNKLGVTLDLENSRAREMLMRMLERADIVFNPNAPALCERLGLDWRTLTRKFPKLIAGSVTYFGTDSPYRDYRGGDLVATHMSGVGFETPWHQVTDPETEPPLKLAGRQADYLTGYTAAAAAMAAVFDRKNSGRGQHIDTSQWLAMISMLRPNIGVYSHESPEAPIYERTRKRIKRGAQWVYPSTDGWVSFNAGTDRFWRGWRNVMGNPEWMDTEMFSTPVGRAAHVDAIEAAIIDWLSNETRTSAFEKAQAEHVPCFPVHTPSEVAENAQYAARGFFADHEPSGGKKVRMPGAPCRMSATPWRIKRGAPRLGEHNRKIFVERLGLSVTDLESLTSDRVI
ncbi:MAG: CaiB/BaiF CoA transferase family protein [Candidatus Binataceae bacterium]